MITHRMVHGAIAILFATSALLAASIRPIGAPPAYASTLWSGDENANGGSPAWQEYVGIDLASTLHLSVNTVTGNLLASYALPPIPGVNGLDQNMVLRYNSFDRGVLGSPGYGWGLNMSRDVGLDVSNANAPVFVDPSGHPWTFTKSGSAFTSPPGIDADLVQNGDSTYTLTDHASQGKYQFTAAGYLTAIQNRSGNQIKFQYSGPCALPSTIINSEDQTTRFVNGACTLNTIDMPDGRTFITVSSGSSYELGTIAFNDGSGAKTTFAYDASHDLVQITDRNGNVTKIAYANGGAGPAVASITQITNTQQQTGPAWTFAYSTGSTSVTDPNSHTTTYGYDGSGRVTSITYPDTTTEQQTWTSDNQLHQDILPSGATTTYSYDSLNRLTGETLANGATESWTYNNGSFPYNADSYTDTQGNTTSYGFNSQGLVNKVTDALNHVTGMVYNSNGTLTSVTDANNHTTSYSYDSYGRLETETPPSPLGATTYSYTAENWLASELDGKNQLTSYSYDSFGELQGASYADKSSVGYAYDQDGNALSLADGSGTTNYTPNALNQITKEVLPNGQTISYVYDAVDNLLSKTDSGGQVSYGYTVNDELHSVTDPQGQQTTYGYDQDGNQTKISYPNGVTESMGYDPAGQLTSIAASGCTSGTCPSFTYSYTNPTTGKPTTQRYSMTDASGTTTNYSYDALNRLTSAVSSTSSYSYGYDPVGNMTSEDLNGSSTTLSYNAADEITQASGGIDKYYGFDANGNLAGICSSTPCPRENEQDALTISYNAQDQATSMTPPPGNDPIAMSYSDFGQSDRLSNGTQSYQNDQTGISAITDTVAKTTTSYTRTPDGQLISERIPTGATGCPTGGPAVCDEYYLFDGLGSVVALTDSHGAVVNSYSYDPYGNATASETVPNPFRFTGAIWDSSTGLYKMGERFYDPTIGRFTQLDPAGGEYGYAYDNPVNFTDDSGLRPNCNPRIVCRPEHKKGKRPSTKGKHQKGRARQRTDQGREKKDSRMRHAPKKKAGQPPVGSGACACGSTYPIIPGLPAPDEPGYPEPYPVPGYGFA